MALETSTYDTQWQIYQRVPASDSSDYKSRPKSFMGVTHWAPAGYLNDVAEATYIVPFGT